MKGNVLVGDTTWEGGSSNASGLAIQTTSSSSSPYAMYIKNSDGDEIYALRCDGTSTLRKLYLGEDKVDLRTELNLKDKLIEKLSVRLDSLEQQLKALK